ncbi:MAG: hypothetical protein PUN43_00950 [Candidatus Liberibacter asiaticus]|nr:hypothetical protein [Candidatus Liberibacter asiaticus]
MRAKTLLASTLVTTAITIIGCSLVEDNRIESLRMVKEAKMEVLEAHKLAKEYVDKLINALKKLKNNLMHGYLRDLGWMILSDIL